MYSHSVAVALEA